MWCGTCQRCAAAIRPALGRTAPPSSRASAAPCGALSAGVVTQAASVAKTIPAASASREAGAVLVRIMGGDAVGVWCGRRPVGPDRLALILVVFACNCKRFHSGQAQCSQQISTAAAAGQTAQTGGAGHGPQLCNGQRCRAGDRYAGIGHVPGQRCRCCLRWLPSGHR